MNPSIGPMYDAILFGFPVRALRLDVGTSVICEFLVRSRGGSEDDRPWKTRMLVLVSAYGRARSNEGLRLQQLRTRG